MKPKGELRDKPLSVSGISCKSGETSRPLGVRIMEHKYNIRQGYFDRLKLLAQELEEGYQID
jgi:hypothetical protein